MSYKPRILWVGEATFLNTGYAVYGKELLNRLYKSNKFVLAELASYGTVDDHRRHDLPWIYYGNVPYKDDKQALEEYYANPVNEFGDWIFNDVCLDFEPDIVISITDPWMHEYQFSSPYRPLYKMVVMPTIDSAPQQPQWMSMYMEADRIATYSSYGKRILEEHGNGNIKVFDILRPGYNINSFYPIPNKQELRKQLRVPINNNDVIFGTVMRNQKRKLFDDLFIAFRLFLDQHPEYATNTLLYCHTSFPDQGWDIPRLLKEHKLANKVLFTYVCRKCHNILPSFFNDVVRICPFCGDRMHMSNTHMGATNEQLGKIYNLFDFYVQYSTCLGKDEEVLTKDGWKKISEVKIGDQVFTHKHNWKSVTKTFKNLPKNNVKEIKVWGDYEKLIVTDNHPIYCISTKNTSKRSLREYIGNILFRNSKHMLSFDFKQIQDLNIADLIVYPIDDTTIDITKIDTSIYAKSNAVINKDYIEVKSGKKHKRYIDIDIAFCKFLGLYVADGSSTSQNIIRITQNIRDTQNIELIINVCQNTFHKMPSLRKYTNRNGIDISIYSSIYNKMFKDWCSRCKNKQLPNWSLHLPLEKQKAILQGLFMGDGCYFKKKNISLYCTISPILAQQIKYLLRRLRINYNVRIVNKGDNRQPQYRFEIFGNILNGEFEIIRNNSRNFYFKNYHILQIKSINDVEYQDDTYNLEVETDNSYVTRVGAVHNCEGLGIPAVEAAACSTPVLEIDYSAMEDVVRCLSGVQIPVKRLYREAETHMYRAYPDNDFLADQFYKCRNMGGVELTKWKHKTLEGAVKYFNWDDVAIRWINMIDSLKINQSVWKTTKPFIYQPNTNINQDLPNHIFIEQAIYGITGKNDLFYRYIGSRILRDLNYGARIKGFGGVNYSTESFFAQRMKFQPYTKKDVIDDLKIINDKNNKYEYMRMMKYQGKYNPIFNVKNAKK